MAEVRADSMRARLVDAWLAEHEATHGESDENELRTPAADAGVPYVGVPYVGAGRVALPKRRPQ